MCTSLTIIRNITIVTQNQAYLFRHQAHHTQLYLYLHPD
jgi:hypothetical protein